MLRLFAPAALALVTFALAGCSESVAPPAEPVPDLRCPAGTALISVTPTGQRSHNESVTLAYTTNAPAPLAAVWQVDGEAATTATVTHTYPTPGTHPVEVRIFTADGCVVLGQHDLVLVNQAPLAHFSKNVIGDTMYLDARGSKDPNGDPLTVTWLMDGVEVGTGMQTLKPVPPAGTIVGVVVSDPFGGVDRYQERYG
jgi:hypothetical protein